MIARSLLQNSSQNHLTLFGSALAHQPLFRIPFSSLSSSQHSAYSVERLNHKDWLAPNEVLKIFRTLTDSESVIPFLDKLARRKDYKPNEALYTAAINTLARVQKFDSIDAIMNKIKAEKNCRLSDEFFYNLIKLYGNVGGRINKSVETLFDMPTYNCWPALRTFNFVLNLLISSKHFDIVHHVYASSSKLAIAVDACSLNILIKGLCENGNVDSAFKVFDEFPKQKCRPNVRSYSTLMHGLCELGRLEEALCLFPKMEEDGISPDTVMFNILISGLRKHGRIEEGLELLGRMELKGCISNTGSHQEILYGLLNAERYAEAKKFMEKMIVRGMTPSFRSFRLIIKGLCAKNHIEDACWALKQMIQHRFEPRRGMWVALLKSIFLKNGACGCGSDCLENVICT